jgi:hypothetical protein
MLRGVLCSNKSNFQRMMSSGMLRRVALVRTDVSEEPGASLFRETRIGELATDVRCEETPSGISSQLRRSLVAACVVPSSPILVTLMNEEPDSSETSVLTRATRRNIPEDTILHSHHRENLKSYKSNFGFNSTSVNNV